MSISGNITNNGTWTNSYTDLRTTQTREIETTNPIGNTVTLYDDFTISNSPVFSGNLNFNGHILNIESPNQITMAGVGNASEITGGGDITLTGHMNGSLDANDSKIYIKGAFSGTATSTNETIFEGGSVSGNGFTLNSDATIQGTSTVLLYGDGTINGSLTIDANSTLKNYHQVEYVTLTVNGDVVNNGTITDDKYGYWYAALTMSISGNITNNGTWTNSYTHITWPVYFGATSYLLNISSDIDNWPSPAVVNNTFYNVSNLINNSNYWRVRADLGNGLYSPWSDVGGINADLFSGFTFSNIDSSSQMATKPINLTINAININGDPYDYNGTVNLSASNNGTTTPSSITMTDGTWTGTTSIAIFGDNVTLTATGNGGSGTSNTFNLKKKPVIIVPGIAGSRLKASTTDAEIWPNLDEMVLPGDDYLDELILNNNGWPTTSSVVTTGDIIREITIVSPIYNIHFFDNLIDLLEDNGYVENDNLVENNNLFVFPYDWRLDVAYTADNSFREKIESIKNQTGAEEVDIIAHSMGGLVAKKYIQDYGHGSVDKFIDIATPHLGSPKAAKTMLYGDNFDIPILNQNKVKEISRNFSSMYQLLPSPNYHHASSTIFSSYINDVYDADNDSVTGYLDYDDSIDFLNHFTNLNLTSSNNTLHSEIDDFDPNDYNVKAYNIVGCHNPTIGWVDIINKYGTSTHEYGLHYITGDGTVPLESARALDNTIGTYYNSTEDDGATHSHMPSFDGNRQLINAILNSTSSTVSFDFSPYANLRQDDSYCTPLNGWEVSYHSPIALHIYDEQGRHIGPDANGNIEINIPGAAYDVIGDNKFAFVPKGHNYKVTGQATGLGHFNARIQAVQNGETISTAYYNEVPIKSLGTNIEINFADDKPNYEMKMDQIGDKVFKEKIKPSAILNAKESADRTKPETKAEISGRAIKLTSKDDNSKILKIEYSLDSGKTWNLYTKPIDISQLSGSTIQYKSTDRAGNVEIVTEQDVHINKDTRNINISGSRKLKF